MGPRRLFLRAESYNTQTFFGFLAETLDADVNRENYLLSV